MMPKCLPIFCHITSVRLTRNSMLRVRATGRHYRQMRGKNIFGTKKHCLAKTSGEKKISSKNSAPKNVI